MSAADERTQLAAAVEKLLGDESWTPDDEASLPEKVKWTPDRIFIKADGKKLALEVEERINIPRFLTRIIELNPDSFENTKVIISAVRNNPISIETAIKGIKHDISIYAGLLRPMLVLDSSFPRRIQIADSELINQAMEHFNQKKNIPSILLHELSSLEQVEYAADLRQFAHDYERNQFRSWEEEHRFVHDFLKDRFGRLLGESRFFEGLNALSLLEEVSEVMLSRRPHFIHSFQTFILGAIIIEKNYDHFREIYSNRFDTDQDISIDLPWFFASMFHDASAPFENIERISPTGQHREVRSRGMYSLYTPHLLSCLFETLKNSAIDPEWEPQPDMTAGELCDLLAHNRCRDHGVMGAVSLISSAQYLNRRTMATVIYPSALAISIHNSRIWSHLVERRLLPVSAERFPLAFLLMLCDNVEEWGREPHHIELSETAPKALITGLAFDEDITTIDLWVDDPARAVVLRNRFDWINKILFQTENVQIDCSFSLSGDQ